MAHHAVDADDGEEEGDAAEDAKQDDVLAEPLCLLRRELGDQPDGVDRMRRVDLLGGGSGAGQPVVEARADERTTNVTLSSPNAVIPA